jgi:hypothetical protein
MTMPNGTLLEVLERRPDGWWRVRVVPSGQEGWTLSGQGQDVWIECCKAGLDDRANDFARPHVPILAGGKSDDGMDACPSAGDVDRLDFRGAPVRSGPGGRFKELDKLHNGQHVFICERRGLWFGIVYHRGDASGEDAAKCEVDRPWSFGTKYTGPCHSGWIFKEFVKHLKG